MNVLILLVFVSEICLGFCAWLSPQCLRWLAAYLLTRADVIETAKKENDRRIRFWRGELGLDGDPVAVGKPPLPSHSAGRPKLARTKLNCGI